MENENEILTENRLNTYRWKIVNNLCQYTPFFVFPIVANYYPFSWVLTIVGLVVVILLSFLYKAAFHKFFMPKGLRRDHPSKKEKLFYYSMMVACPVLTVLVYKLTPLTEVINAIIALVFNFALTMVLCYKVAAK